MTRLLEDILLAALMIAAPPGLKYAQSNGLVPMSAEELSERTMGVIIGLLLVFMANMAPKKLKPLAETSCEPGRSQTVRRATGATFVLAGFGYAASWLFAPIEQASFWGIGVVGLALVATIARCFTGRSA